MITPVPDISEVWPEVFDAVVTALRRRGIGLHSAEDATQEAGSRVLANGIGYADADDLRRWVQTVAWRLAIDETRRQSRYDDGESMADTASFQEVPAEVEHRLRLAATSRAWRALSPADRQAIVGDGDVRTMSRKEAVRLNVRRHRARARLLALVEGVAAVVLVPMRRMRRISLALAVAAVLPITALVVPFVRDTPGPGGGGVSDASGSEVARPIVGLSLADAFDPSDLPAFEPAPAAATLGTDSETEEDAEPTYPSPFRNINARVDTPMPDDQDQYIRSAPREEKPIACVWPVDPSQRICTPPLPVTVPPPPDPTGQL